MTEFLKRLMAEFTGAAAIVIFGCGLVVYSVHSGIEALMSYVPLSFGLTVCLMIIAFARVSGAHFNPAVTLAFAMVKKHPWREVIPYGVSQFMGGLFGCFILSFLFPSTLTYASTQPAVEIKDAFIIEFVLTFLLMFVIKTMSDSRQSLWLVASMIGLTVCFGAFYGGSFTGASMNPARSLGPAIYEGNFNHLWLYLTAPLLGGVTGGIFSTYLRCVIRVRSLNTSGCC